MAGSGRSNDDDDDAGVAGDDHRGDHADQAEQRRLLRRQHGDDAGRLGDREVEVRPGDRVGAADDLGDLVGPAGVPDEPVDRRVDGGLGLPLGAALAALDLLDELARAGPRAPRRSGRRPGRGCTACGSTSRRTPCGRPRRRRGRPCARRARRWRGSGPWRPRRRTSGRTRCAGTRRRCRACRSCARRARARPSVGFGSAVSGQGRPPVRGGRPRGRSPTPCSRRRGWSGRSG